MSGRLRALLIVLGALFVPAAAAANVYLNGVDITGVTNQTFEKATVHIDSDGNVRISAPGYAVSGPSGGHAQVTTDTGTPTSRYYLVTSHADPGATQYDIDLYVNAKWIRKLRSTDDQIVADITRYLHTGQNKILLMASKNLEGGRKSRSPSKYFRVIIGSGNMGGNNVMIDQTLVDFKVTAEQTQDISRTFTITVK